MESFPHHTEETNIDGGPKIPDTHRV